MNTAETSQSSNHTLHPPLAIIKSPPIRTDKKEPHLTFHLPSQMIRLRIPPILICSRLEIQTIFTRACRIPKHEQLTIGSFAFPWPISRFIEFLLIAACSFVAVV